MLLERADWNKKSHEGMEASIEAYMQSLRAMRECPR